MAGCELTQDHESLLGRVRIDLGLRVPDVPDLIADIGEGAENGEVDQAPCPPEGPPNLPWLLGRGSRLLRVVPLELTGDGSYAASSKRPAGWCRGQGTSRGCEDARCDSVLLHASDTELPGRELIQGQSSRGGSHGFESRRERGNCRAVAV